MTLAIALWQGLPSVLDSLKSPEPAETVQTFATQEAFDDAQKRITILETQVQRLGEIVCAMNEGSPGPDWPCDLQAYPPPRNSPPKFRTDRVFPAKANQ